MIIDDGSPFALPQQGVSCLDRFRVGLYSCMTRRGDALFELVDAVACGSAPVRDLAHLSLEVEHRRGHGACYDAIGAGHIEVEQVRQLIAQAPIPTIASPTGQRRIVLAVDVSNWLRPDATTSPDRAFCHTYARGRGQADMIPGWQYSFVAALEAGATSWTALLDVVRLHPGDDATVITAAQLRRVVESLQHSGHLRTDDPDVLIVFDAGYDVTRLAWLLDDLPVTLIGRLRSHRVFYAPAGTRAGPTRGRPPRHGARLVLADAATHPDPIYATVNDTHRYGRAEAQAFAHMHPRIDSRGGWKTHTEQLPLIEGTILGVRVERLPGNRHPKPMWLWVSKPVPDSGAEIDHWWSMFIRRFDLEHTFRFLKQSLGWTKPRLRETAAADRWTWIIMAAHTQLRLARPLAIDHRLPWQKPLTAMMLTPARVRAGYRRVHAKAARPAREPKHTRPGPGRPKGRQNSRKTPVQPVGKPPTG